MSSKDPYFRFRFQILIDDNVVAGAASVSGLTRSTPLRSTEGVDPPMNQLTPAETEWGPITLERGLSCNEPFVQWCNKLLDYSNPMGQPDRALDFRKAMAIHVCNEVGITVLAFHVNKAWVSEFSGMSELDGRGDSFVFESMTIQHEGWTRD